MGWLDGQTKANELATQYSNHIKDSEAMAGQFFSSNNHDEAFYFRAFLVAKTMEVYIIIIYSYYKTQLLIW